MGAQPLAGLLRARAGPRCRFRWLATEQGTADRLSTRTVDIADENAVDAVMAGVVAMLISEDGAFITGTEIRIDGWHPHVTPRTTDLSFLTYLGPGT